MEEIKVSVTKDEFISLIVNEVTDMAKDKAGLSIILSGGIVTDILCKELFGESDTVCVTEDEYCQLTSTAITNFTNDKENEVVAIPVMLLAVLISSRVRRKLFNKEEDTNNGN